MTTSGRRNRGTEKSGEATAAPTPTSIGAAVTLSLALLAFFVVAVYVPSFAHAEFSSEQLTAITEHVYRGSPWEKTCHATCEELWTAEGSSSTKELELELLDLRQEQELLPLITSYTPAIPLDSVSSTQGWWVPGESPKIITIELPGETESKWCNAEYYCEQAVFSVGQGYDLGASHIKAPAAGLTWYWWTYPGGWHSSTFPPGEWCFGQPSIPGGMQAFWGYESLNCRANTKEEVGFLGQPGFVTSTPIHDAGELPYDFKSYGTGPDPGFETVKEGIDTALSSDRYPYLDSWYHFQLGDGCSPEGATKCELPGCRGLTLAACEALLEFAGFTELSHSTASDEETNFYAPPDRVAETEPSAGSEVTDEEQVNISVNPEPGVWDDILLNRFNPIMVLQPKERFEPESSELMTDWPFNALERKHGKTIQEPTASFLGYYYTDEEPAVSEDLIDSVSGVEGEHTAAEEAQFIVEGLGFLDPEKYLSKVYARVVADPTSEVTWLQYWFFYYDNPPIPGAEEFGQHEGDWEMAQFEIAGLPLTGLNGEESEVGAGPHPFHAAAAEHNGGSTCGWEELSTLEDRPVLYAGADSHATYFAGGEYPTEFPPLNEFLTENLEEVEIVEPQVVSVSEADGWVQWPGHWGGTQPGEVPGEDESPTGPIDHEQWSKPTEWDATLSPGGGC